MNRCTDPGLGSMLHAWELGMLSDEDRQRFELHLLRCETCADEACQFSQAGKLLQGDSELRPAADELVKIRDTMPPESHTVRRKITRILLVAAVILAVAIPIYRMTMPPHNESHAVQRLNLVPIRGDGENTVRRNLGGTVEILFYMENIRPNSEYRVVLTTSANSILFYDDHYRRSGASGSGKITLPANTLPVGICTLIIFPSGDSSAVLHKYNFRVE
jgi:Putative zinc-finger